MKCWRGILCWAEWLDIEAYSEIRMSIEEFQFLLDNLFKCRELQCVENDIDVQEITILSYGDCADTVDSFQFHS